MSDPVRLLDWDNPRFFRFVAAAHIVYWVMAGLDLAGVDIVPLRQIVGTAYAFFTPGLLLLRILRFRGNGPIEVVLYSVGISVACIMGVGLAANFVLPRFGLPEPLSHQSILIAVSALTLVMSTIAWLRNRDYRGQVFTRTRWFPQPAYLGLMLIPLLSVLGTMLLNRGFGNSVLVALIVIVGIVGIIIGARSSVSSGIYPAAVIMISLALVFYRSLVSMYISGFDIHEEYYEANRVISSGLWDASMSSVYNTIPSVTILAPMGVGLTGVDLTWMLKIIYPALFALVPLGLYRIFPRMTNDRISFLACFFFMVVYQFYTDAPILIRQQMAMLFLVLLVMGMTDDRIEDTRKAMLYLIFTASLVVSHYGLAVLWLGYLIVALVIAVVWPLAGRLRFLRGSGPSGRLGGGGTSAVPLAAFTFTHIGLYVVMFFAWYMFISGGVILRDFTIIGNQIVVQFSNYLLDPTRSHGLALLTTAPRQGIMPLVNAALNYSTQVFLVVGVGLFLWISWRSRSLSSLVCFMLVSLIMIVAGVVVPYVTRAINMERLYHFGLVFLAPCFVIGFQAFISWLRRAARLPVAWRDGWQLKAASVYLAIFLLFQSGVVWLYVDGLSPSVSIGQDSIAARGTKEMKVALQGATTVAQDVKTAEWMSRFGSRANTVYATHLDVRVHALTSYGGWSPRTVLWLTRDISGFPADSYVLLQYINVVDRLTSQFDPSLQFGRQQVVYGIDELEYLWQSTNKVYANGGGEVRFSTLSIR